MGSRGTSNCYIFQHAPCEALLQSDLALHGHQEDNYSFIISTCALLYYSYEEILYVPTKKYEFYSHQNIDSC
jgi:hypothetical protein